MCGKCTRLGWAFSCVFSSNTIHRPTQQNSCLWASQKMFFLDATCYQQRPHSWQKKCLQCYYTSTIFNDKKQYCSYLLMEPLLLLVLLKCKSELPFFPRILPPFSSPNFFQSLMPLLFCWCVIKHTETTTSKYFIRIIFFCQEQPKKPAEEHHQV